MKFLRRVLVCRVGQDQVKAFYPGSSNGWKDPQPGLKVLLKAYETPKPVCSHYVIAGDPAMHGFNPGWIGLSTLHYNDLFASLVSKGLWSQSDYRRQVKLGSHRIDFYFPGSGTYCQVKAQWVLNKRFINSERLGQHLRLLNEQPKAMVLFMCPYAKHNPWEDPDTRQMLSQYSHITYGWVYISYDLQGGVWYRGLDLWKFQP